MKAIYFLLNLLVFIVPLTFFPMTYELFEFNKIILVYIFTVLIAGAWALECIKKKKIIFKKTPLFLPILLFLISQVLSTIFSIDKRTSLLGYYGRFHGGLLSYFCYSIIYFAFVTFMDQEKTIKFLKTLFAVSIIAAIYAAVEHFGYSPSCLLINGSLGVNCWEQDVQTRVFGTFGQPNWLAAWLSATIPLFWAFMIYNTGERRKNFKFIFFLILSTLFFITILFTKSRSGFLAFWVAFAIFWLPKIRRNFLAFVVTAVFCLISAALVWNPFTANAQPPPEGVTESGEIRKIVWSGAFELWKKYPILGTGVETFGHSYYETRPATHNLTSEWNFFYNKAHNEYLNFAATTGSIGLFAYIVLITGSLFAIYTATSTISLNKKSKKFKIKLINSALFAGYISIMMTNFFGFSTVTTSILLFMFPAIAQSAKNKKEVLQHAKPKNLSIAQKSLIISLSSLVFIILAVIFRYWLADYYYTKGDYKKAVYLSPGEALFRLAFAKSQSNPEELEKAINLAPRNVQLLKQIASAFDDLGKTEKSLETYIKITKLAPTDAQTFYNTALVYTKLGKYEEAKTMLEKTLKMKPDYKKAQDLMKLLNNFF